MESINHDGINHDGIIVMNQGGQTVFCFQACRQLGKGFVDADRVFYYNICKILIIPEGAMGKVKFDCKK